VLTLLPNIPRWQRAIRAEQDFWAKHPHTVQSREEWDTLLREFFHLDLEAFHGQTTLEVGCGLFGLIHVIDAEWAIGIDPLPLHHLDVGHDQAPSYLRGVGEHLPFSNDIFDICICMNVLDHTLNPCTVLNEIARVIKMGGICLLWINTIRNAVKQFKSLFSRLDTPHPHHFTETDVDTLIANTSLRITSRQTRRLPMKSLKSMVASYMVNQHFLILKNAK
jgi:SAM-dependent methyltransferase